MSGILNDKEGESMSEVTYLNAGHAHLKTDAVNIYIDNECVALVRNERSIEIVKSKLSKKGEPKVNPSSDSSVSDHYTNALSWGGCCEICGIETKSCEC